MNKLLLLLPSLASADLIQDSYKEQFYQLSKANFEIITAFLVIFIIAALVYIFSLANNSARKGAHTAIVQVGDIIKKVHSKITTKDIDLLRILDSYLSILHQKAGNSGNKIYFNFNHNYPRHVKAMQNKLCVLFYTLAEFVIEHTKNSHIFIGARIKKFF